MATPVAAAFDSTDATASIDENTETPPSETATLSDVSGIVDPTLHPLVRLQDEDANASVDRAELRETYGNRTFENISIIVAVERTPAATEAVGEADSYTAASDAARSSAVVRSTKAAIAERTSVSESEMQYVLHSHAIIVRDIDPANVPAVAADPNVTAVANGRERRIDVHLRERTGR